MSLFFVRAERLNSGNVTPPRRTTTRGRPDRDTPRLVFSEMPSSTHACASDASNSRARQRLMATTRPTALRPSMYMPRAIWLRKTTRKARHADHRVALLARRRGGRKKPLHPLAPCRRRGVPGQGRHTPPRPVARTTGHYFRNADRACRMIV